MSYLRVLCQYYSITLQKHDQIQQYLLKKMRIIRSCFASNSCPKLMFILHSTFILSNIFYFPQWSCLVIFLVMNFLKAIPFCFSVFLRMLISSDCCEVISCYFTGYLIPVMMYGLKSENEVW